MQNYVLKKYSCVMVGAEHTQTNRINWYEMDSPGQLNFSNESKLITVSFPFIMEYLFSKRGCHELGCPNFLSHCACV